ncbi:MAG: hypothetical protein RML36_04920 [Anaerolineae bacterium]|nr:hypothetical protein [Anaerolineae bacterium]MDW8098816.1 hypothetical protein [Anaerolineae bacterium]
MNPFPFLPFLERLHASVALLDGLIGVLLLIAITTLMIVATNWRLIVAGMGAQSVLLAVLAARHSPLEWAFLRMVTGGLVTGMWILSAQATRWGRSPERWLRWRWPPLSAHSTLRLIVVILVALFLLSIRPWSLLKELEPDLGILCVWLAAMGLLALALSDEVLTAGIGLLWWLEAFHLYYSALERNVVTEGIAGVMKLLVGLSCAYLIVAQRANTRVFQTREDQR